MIRSETELATAQQALGDLYRALAALRKEFGESNSRGFALLAEGPLHQIAEIQAQIDAYTGAIVARQIHAPLWLRLSGERAQWGETPASVLTAFLDALRKGLQSIAGYNVTGKASGRPTLEIQNACDIEVVDFAPGSFQIGVRLPDPDQASLFSKELPTQAESALEDFLYAAQWAAGSQSVADLTSHFRDATKRRVVLRAVKAFVPRSHGGIDFVELSGSAVPGGATLQVSQGAIQAILQALESAVSTHEQSFEGDIREMDLDRQTFRLRNVPEVSEVRCHFGDDLYPLATDLLGKRVRVIGTRQVAPEGDLGALEIVDIEKLGRSRS